MHMEADANGGRGDDAGFPPTRYCHAGLVFSAQAAKHFGFAKIEGDAS